MEKSPCVMASGCCACGMSRRQFLAGCAAGMAAVGSLSTMAFGESPAAGGGKAKVRLVFTHTPSTGPIWPNIGYDFDRRKKQLTEGLARSCPNIEFVPVTAMSGDQARKLVEGDKDIDGYLVYMVGIWTGAPEVIGAAGKPTVFVDDLYGGSGEFLIANAAARRAGQKVVGVSTSRFEDVVHAARCFEILKQPGKSADDFLAACNAARKKCFGAPGDLRCASDSLKAGDMGKCLERLRASKILVVGSDPGATGKSIQDVFGTPVVPIDFKTLDEAYEKADRGKAAEVAARWTREAEKVIEPSREEIEKCAAMYIAMSALLEREKAQAIAINCLGGFYSGQMKAYPCLGFCQFNNDGGVGACEADLRSTITMLAMTYLTGRPGYISDPVIDTSKNQIIYAHCVAPTKVFGPAGSSNPYHIRSHSEDRKGASMRSLMPIGYLTSTLTVDTNKKEIIFHQGKSVENIDQDMACRTKLAAEVKGDIDKLLTEWDRWSWHRVTFYGDLKAPVQELGKAIGFKVVEEA